MISPLRTVLVKLATFIALVTVLSACSDGSDGPPSLTLPGCADTGTCASNPQQAIGGDRPAMVRLPSNYDINTRYPLVMVLHGRGVTGFIQSVYLGLFDRVDSRQFILLYPDGLVLDGQRQWRFSPTCCDTPAEEAANISDVSYLSGLIEEAAATYSIDTTRVGLFGHSSGGFMAFTMACEASHLVTSIINLAGSTFFDLERCQPAAQRVSVLTVHGDLDDTVSFEGLEGVFLSAPAAADRYAMLAGCDTNNPASKPAIDLIGNIDGAETSVTSWPGCLRDTEVEFWKMNDGPHIPGPWVQEGLDRYVDWLLDHSRN